tara:strand:+ start:1255 stop:1476 length:222 start_codon:yes stop_codon:yes gene_type:complete
MRKVENEYDIRTYNNGVLHFVIGSEYKAIGTCGESKDIEVKGTLLHSPMWDELQLYSHKTGYISINEQTLSYL